LDNVTGTETAEYEDALEGESTGVTTIYAPAGEATGDLSKVTGVKVPGYKKPLRSEVKDFKYEVPEGSYEVDTSQAPPKEPIVDNVNGRVSKVTWIYNPETNTTTK
jgi:hypothetical protein